MWRESQTYNYTCLHSFTKYQAAPDLMVSLGMAMAGSCYFAVSIFRVIWLYIIKFFSFNLFCQRLFDFGIIWPSLQSKQASTTALLHIGMQFSSAAVISLFSKALTALGHRCTTWLRLSDQSQWAFSMISNFE